MKALVLGSGRMSKGIVFDLLNNERIETVFLVDQSAVALEDLSSVFNDPRIKTTVAGADDLEKLTPLFQKADGALSAVPYDYNRELTRLAIESKTHFVDLGGNYKVVRDQFKMTGQARESDVGVFPDCGLAPGMTSVLSAHLVSQLARVDTLKIRVGGLPLEPQTPLNYMLVFSVHGLINEYLEDAIILEDGHIKMVSSMTDVEELEFPRPFGLLEAFNTSGGTSTLPYTFENSISYLDYKTIRYPGHCHIMKAMLDLGFAEEKKIRFGDVELSKRDAFEQILSPPLHYESDDVVLIRVTATGQKGGSRKTLQLQAIEYGDKENGLTAMMRTTAFPATVILQMLMENKIKDRGVLYQEKSVPTTLFLEEMEKRNIKFDVLD
jgi:lysine 6-dehydrogenase